MRNVANFAIENPSSFFLSITILVASYLILQRVWSYSTRSNPKRLPLPPGPKGWPFVGSMFDMPSSEPWITYNEWAKIYGMPL